MSHTPGPWGWRGHAKGGPIELVGLHGDHPYVMRFARHGMQGGQPTFPTDERMVPASELAISEVTYADRVREIDHPNARLIAAAPALLEAAQALLAWAEDVRGAESARRALAIEAHYPVPSQHPIAVLRAAIAQATGEAVSA